MISLQNLASQSKDYLKSIRNLIIQFLRVRTLFNSSNNYVGLPIFEFFGILYNSLMFENDQDPLKSQEISYVLITLFELLGNYQLNKDVSLKAMIQNLLSYQSHEDSALLLT